MVMFYRKCMQTDEKVDSALKSGMAFVNYSSEYTEICSKDRPR